MSLPDDLDSFDPVAAALRILHRKPRNPPRKGIKRELAQESLKQPVVPRRMFGKEDIAALSLQEYRHTEYPTCVYFLFHSEKIVYVGQTVNLVGRIQSHLSDKYFDRVLYLPVSKEELDVVEEAFIKTLKPKYNSPLTSKNFLKSHEKALRKYGCEHLIPFGYEKEIRSCPKVTDEFRRTFKECGYEQRYRPMIRYTRSGEVHDHENRHDSIRTATVRDLSSS